MKKSAIFFFLFSAVCMFAACNNGTKESKKTEMLDDAFFNAAELASGEICDCESPSECMNAVIDQFEDYRSSKAFRDEVIKRVLECQEAKRKQQDYEKHFDEAVEAVAKDLCGKGKTSDEDFYESAERLYPNYGYKDDPHFKQEAIEKAKNCKAAAKAPKATDLPIW